MEKYSPIFNVENEEQLNEFVEFIGRAKRSTSSNNPDEKFHRSKTRSWPDGVRRIIFSDGPWDYVDGRDGGNNVDRLIKIYYNKKPVFIMHCEGGLTGEVANPSKDEVYICLRNALRNFDPKEPWRGPEEFNDESGFSYRSKIVRKSKKDFYIEEEIHEPYGATLYKAICKCSFV